MTAIDPRQRRQHDRRRASRPLLGTAALLALAWTGCAGPETTARTTFSQSFNCPAQRIRVTQTHGRPYLPPPPPEIANDPDRLAIYEHRNEVYWRAIGCAEEAFYRCYRPLVTEPAYQCDPMNKSFPGLSQ